MVEEYKGFKVPPLKKGAEEKVCDTLMDRHRYDCDSSSCAGLWCIDCLFCSWNQSTEAYEQWVKEHEEGDGD